MSSQQHPGLVRLSGQSQVFTGETRGPGRAGKRAADGVG